MIQWQNILWYHYIILSIIFTGLIVFGVPILYGISKALVEEIPKEANEFLKHIIEFWKGKK